MSWEANAYVVGLRRCVDGWAMNRGQKLLLLILSRYHDPDRQCAYPGVPRLAEESMCSIPQAKRDLAFFEAHKTIWSIPGRGRGHFTYYGFVELDGPCPGAGEKGSLATPFCPAKKGSERVQKLSKKGSERVHPDSRNKEETRFLKPIPDTRTRTETESRRLLLRSIASDGTPVTLESWVEIQAQMARGMNLHSFDTWIRSTKAIAVGDALLVVAVPGAEWLHMVSKFTAEIEASVAACGIACKQIDLVAQVGL